MHDAGTGGLGFFLVALHHLADPLHFAGQVAIIRATAHARLHQRLTVKRVGANGGNNDSGLLAHGLLGGLVGRIRQDHWQVFGFGAKLTLQGVELALGATGNCPFHRLAHSVGFEQVTGENLANETGGSENHKVIGRF